jgi:hypothetical protein
MHTHNSIPSLRRKNHSPHKRNNNSQDTALLPPTTTRRLRQRRRTNTLPSRRIAHTIRLIHTRNRRAHVEPIHHDETRRLAIHARTIAHRNAQAAQTRLGVRGSRIRDVCDLDAEQRVVVEEVVHDEHAVGFEGGGGFAGEVGGAVGVARVV